MSEETVTVEELKELRETKRKHEELTKQLESSEEVKIDGSTAPGTEDPFLCKNCNDNGVETEIKKGQESCTVCGEGLQWF